jgi:hypothetical protein
MQFDKNKPLTKNKRGPDAEHSTAPRMKKREKKNNEKTYMYLVM